MKALLSLCLLATVVPSFAQEGDMGPKPSAATLKYEKYRAMPTEPKYGLKKVKALIAKTKTNREGDSIMDAKLYEGLSFEEKFTFTMLHGEYFSQNCSEMPVFTLSEKKIFAYPIGAFNDEQMWSERQREFLKKNRTKVIGLLRSTIEDKGRVGPNLRAAILEIEAVELIPDMVRTYGRDRKDHDVLTVLMLLMNNAKYKPFLASPVFKKLYGDEDNSYKAYLEATAANQKAIVALANGFYNSRKH